MADADFQNPTHESIWKVTRQLKKEQCSLYNCVASVFSDAAFVSEVRALYPGTPLLANLRCGLWYTRQADGTCYFKSTDGHNGNWSFSCTRLNWHVCEMAAKHGGVIVVDATRKGKRFPDAMTKTIPIWTAVINRAVALKRAEAAQKQAADCQSAKEEAAEARETAPARQCPSPSSEEAAAAVAAADPSLTLGPAATSSSPPCSPIVPGSAPLPCPETRPPGPPGRLRVQVPGGVCCGNPAGLASPSSSAACSPSGLEAEHCARVGSLSQWLNSPGGLAEWEAARAGALTSSSGSQRRLAAMSSLAICSRPGAPAEYLPYAGEVDEDAGEEQEEEQEEEGDDAVAGSASLDRWAAAGCSLEALVGGGCMVVGEGTVGAASTTAAADATAACEAASALPGAYDHAEPGLDADADGEGEADAETCPAGAVCALSGKRVASSSSASGSSSSSGSASSSRAASRANSCCSDPGDGDAPGLLFTSGSSEDFSRPSSASDSALTLTAAGGSESSGGRSGSADISASGSDVCASDSVFATYSQSSFDSGCGGTGDCSGSSGGLSCLPSLSFPAFPAPKASCCEPYVTTGATDSAADLQSTCCCMAPDLHTQIPDLATSSSTAPQPSTGSLTACPGSLPGHSHPGQGPCACGRWGGFTACTSPCRRPCATSGSHSTAAGGSSSCCDRTTRNADEEQQDPVEAVWDTGLHLPLWVSSNERAQIERRLDGWVEALLRVGADVEGLAKVLRKPLRPLWISQASTIWVDQVAQPDQLPFTPLYLVSASQPHSYVRQTTSVCWRPGPAAAADGGGAASDGSDSDVDAEDADGEGHWGLGSCRSRGQQARNGGRKPSCRQQSQHKQRQQQQHHHPQQHHAWTYVYVPGAGDDEESWAAGLTPAVFWAHSARLLQAGPAGIQDVVQQLLREEAATLAERGTNSTIIGSAVCASSGGRPSGSEALEPVMPGAAAAAAGGAAYAAPTDAHHLLPAGCRPAGHNTPAGAPVPGPCGMYFLGSTRIALGDLASGAAPACWDHVDAVLSCGTTRHPSMHDEPQWPLGSASSSFSTSSSSQSLESRASAHGLDSPVPGAEPVEGSAALCGGGPCAGMRAGVGDGGSNGEELSGDHHRHHHHRHAPRYLHLPVEHFKHSRTSLAEHLEPALRFLSHHLARGRRVLIHDTNGLDTCVCVSVALLLACYGPCGGSGGGSSGTASTNGAGAATGDNNAPEWAQPYRAAAGGLGRGFDHVSKNAVRQRLAYVSACYPPARPTRGMLRQVFNHFVQERPGETAPEVEEP